MPTYKYVANKNLQDSTVIILLEDDKSVGLGGKVELDVSQYQELSEWFIFELVKDRPKVVQSNPKGVDTPSDKA